ncbi:cellulose synthase operon protein YhjQ/BcsQ [Actinomyces sp.]|uniref:nucleotide-binding protein n=1 Tax=Actinomyces sp. TaxID=29317 RepID=UPI0026DB939A|nr:cellulose synthase operon protein YhjQ/BcsQ [Actinomyces sp.]MDO4900996.1 cellulose synthase operon protein YhjQ/BcsQ [Actinomyces sp.]
MDSAAPLAPNVRVLVSAPTIAAPSGPDTAVSDPAPMALPPGLPADIVRTCTGAAPVLSDPADLDRTARALLDEPDVVAVLLLAPQGGRLPQTEPGVLLGSLERCCAPDGTDHLLTLLLTAQHPPRARLIVVTGARGGLGASTFLLHLARACHARGKRVAIVDADPAGSLGLLMGDAVLPGLRWEDLPADEPAFRPEKLVAALPAWLGMPVLTGDGRGGAREPKQLRPALDALRAEHDLVMIDLPRSIAPPADATVLLVSGLDLRSAVAAEALATRLRAYAAPVGTASGEPGAAATQDQVPPDLRTKPGVPARVYTVARKVGEDVTPDELALMTRTEIIAVLPHERAVAQRIARGDDPTRGRGALRTQARSVAERLLADGGSHPEAAPW